MSRGYKFDTPFEVFLWPVNICARATKYKSVPLFFCVWRGVVDGVVFSSCGSRVDREMFFCFCSTWNVFLFSRCGPFPHRK